MQIFVNPNYNFVGWRFRAVIISIVFAAVGFFMMAERGINMGIDFAGGANIVLRFNEPVPIDSLRSVLKDATIQQYGKANENTVLIRLPEQKGEGDYAGAVVSAIYKLVNGDAAGRIDLNYNGRDAIAEMLKSTDPDHKGTGIDAHDYYYGVGQSIISRRSELGLFHNFSEVTTAPGVTSAVSNVLSQRTFIGKFNVLSQETVGPQVGKELQQKALWAVVLSTLAMGVYITVRFDLKFGAGAIVCLIHDVIVAFAFMAMINAEMSLIMVAAFLMIVGYSVNDTVVTYDRVRENQKKLKLKMPFIDLLNLSINQTLSRTILTTGSVVLVLIALIVFGGKVIQDFASVLLVGVLAGTLSTIFIVPIFVIWWEQYFAKKARPAAAPVREAAVEAPLRTKKAKG